MKKLLFSLLLGCFATFAFSQSYYQSGLEQFEKGRYAGAAGYFDRELENKPDNVKALEMRGNSYFALKKFDMAKADLEKARTKGATKALSFMNLGIIYYKEDGNYKLALEQFFKAQTIDPQLAGLYYHMGNAYLWSGDRVSAKAKFDKALLASPDDPDVLVGLATVYNQQKNYQKAYDTADKALKIKERAEGLVQRGAASLQLGKFQDGFDDLTRATIIAEKEPRYHVIRAEALMLAGMVEQALESCNKAIEVDATFAKAYYVRGRAKNEQADFNSACDDFKKAKQLNPKMNLKGNDVGCPE